MCVCKGEFVSATHVDSSALLLVQLFWDLVLHTRATLVGVHPSLSCRFGASLVALNLCRLSVLISLFTHFKPPLLGQVGVLSCRGGCQGELYDVFVILGCIPANASRCVRRRDFLFH